MIYHPFIFVGLKVKRRGNYNAKQMKGQEKNHFLVPGITPVHILS